MPRIAICRAPIALAMTENHGQFEIRKGQGVFCAVSRIGRYFRPKYFKCLSSTRFSEQVSAVLNNPKYF
eukprot:1387257-Amorphochlora_amoeboformis.AAC.1